MSANLRDLSKQFEDKEFVKNYFRNVQDGNEVTSRLNRDGATLNSPNLIAKLVGWLEEAEPSESSPSDAQAQAEQQVNAMNLPSKEEESSKEADSSGGESSSDGSSKPEENTTSPTSKSGGESSGSSKPTSSSGFGSA